MDIVTRKPLRRSWIKRQTFEYVIQSGCFENAKMRNWNNLKMHPCNSGKKLGSKNYLRSNILRGKKLFTAIFYH